MAKSQSLWGTVIAIQANFYRVQFDAKDSAFPEQDICLPFSREEETSIQLLCTRRSLLQKLGHQVMVGDQVCVEEIDWLGGRGAIAAVAPRKSEMDRPPVANAEQVLLVFALAEPNLDPHQLSRFLVKAESTGLNILLGLSKSDLVSAQDAQAWRNRLQSWGYSPYLLSLTQADEFDALVLALRNRMTIVAGPSGVGKSSLINRLIPELELRVAKVSGKLGRGRHTTRHVELFELPQGGLLADTPGFNQPNLNACSPLQLSNFFPEIQQNYQKAHCQFSDCLHRSEPGCVVTRDWERYEEYLRLLAELEQQQQVYGHQNHDDEANLKEKQGAAGQVRLEPRLSQKRFRRESRRSRRQTFSNLTGSLDDLSVVLGTELED